MSYELIKVNERYDGQVTEVVFGPAPANIVSARVMNEISTELNRTIDDAARRHVKLLIVRGAGEHFSYGASVEEHKADAVEDMLPRFHELLRQIIECPVPTLAAVSGLCLGGGFELALACSLIFSTADAKFGVPEIQLGVFPPAASVLLPYKTTDSIACEMVLTGTKFSGADLHRLGAVNRLAESESLDDVVSRFVEKEILPKSASSLRLACQAARRGLAMHYARLIVDAEKLYLDELMSTKDAVEGIESFLEKRSPNWVDE